MRKFKLFLFILGLFSLLGFSSNKTVNASSFEKAQVSVTVLLGNSHSEVGNYSQEHNVGSTFSYTPVDQPDYTFLYWVVNGALRQDLPLDHTFVVQSKMELIAVYRPTTGEHPIIFIDSNGKRLSHQFLADNAEVSSLPTPPHKPMSDFLGYADIRDYSQVLNHIPNVSGPAVYVAKYKISEGAGTYNVHLNDSPLLDENNETIAYSINDVVTLNFEEEGFLYYVDSDTGAILSKDRNYSFTMLKGNRNIIAITEGEDIQLPLVSMHHDYILRDDYDSYLGHYELGEGQTLIEVGVELTETVSGEDHLRRIPATSINDQTDEFLISIKESSNYKNIKVYLTYKEGDVVNTIYNKSRYNIAFNIGGNIGAPNELYAIGSFNNEGSPNNEGVFDESILTDWTLELESGVGYKLTKHIIAEPYSTHTYNIYGGVKENFKELRSDGGEKAPREITFDKTRVIPQEFTVEKWPTIKQTYTVNFSVTAPANETDITRTPDTIYVIGNFNNWTESTAQPLTLNTATGKHEGTVEITSVYFDGVPANAANDIKIEYKFLAQQSWGTAEVIGNNREYVLTLQSEFDIHETVYEWRYEFIVYTGILNNDYAPNVWKGYWNDETMVQAYSPHEPRWYKFTTDRYGQDAYIKNIHDNHGNSEESVAIPLDITNRYIKILAWNNSISRFDISVHSTREALPIP